MTEECTILLFFRLVYSPVIESAISLSFLWSSLALCSPLCFILISLIIWTNSYIYILPFQLRQKSETPWTVLYSSFSTCRLNHFTITQLGLFPHSLQQGFYASTQLAFSCTYITTWPSVNNTHSTVLWHRRREVTFSHQHMQEKNVRTGASCPLRKHWLSLFISTGCLNPD